MKDNLPIFEHLFGDSAPSMPTVFQAHYANRLGRDDCVVATGRMDIWQNPVIRPFAFIFRWTKTLVPVTTREVDTQVVFRTRSGQRSFWYDRRFTLHDRQTVSFVSQMVPGHGGRVVEWTGSGIGWHAAFSFEEGRVHLRHLGYRFRLGRMELPLPLSWLLGRPSATEEALSDTAFCVEMTIQHPFFGCLYSYAGQFQIDEVTLEQ